MLFETSNCFILKTILSLVNAGESESDEKKQPFVKSLDGNEPIVQIPIVSIIALSTLKSEGGTAK